MNFVCPACKIDMYTASTLNKHLESCLKYDEFIKKYVPPRIYECLTCHKKFSNEKYLEFHHQHCT
jgi:hypothetical protein